MRHDYTEDLDPSELKILSKIKKELGHYKKSLKAEISVFRNFEGWYYDFGILDELNQIRMLTLRFVVLRCLVSSFEDVEFSEIPNLFRKKVEALDISKEDRDYAEKFMETILRDYF